MLRSVFGDRISGVGQELINFSFQAGSWLCLGLDTHIPGAVSGQIESGQIDWIRSQLAAGGAQFVALFLHHPPVDVGSLWMDAIGLSGKELLQDLIREEPRIRLVCSGHVHHEYRSRSGSAEIVTTPSTGLQFSPDGRAPTFDAAPPGYRIIELHDDGYSTRVVRLPETRFEPERQESALRSMTAAAFAATKRDLPEGGRWRELHDGQAVLLTAPDDVHGTIVLNLTRALAEWFRTQPMQTRGYACHESGLHVKSQPDTVYYPAICVFQGGQAFSQFDLGVATEVPRLVVDIASSNDRRHDMRLRTTAYLKLGVDVIWIPDPFKKEIQVIRRGAHTLALGNWQFLEGGGLLPGFRIEVEKVFAQPKWWNGRLPDISVVSGENEQTRS